MTRRRRSGAALMWGTALAWLLPGLLVLPAVVPAVADAPKSRERPLVVIHQGPDTRPLADFLGVADPDDPPAPAEPCPLDPEAPPSIDPASFGLPVRSPGLTPGLARARPWPAEASRPLAAGARPLALVGADDHSLAWLRRHRHTLKEQGAVIMVVQAETRRDLERIAAAAPELPRFAASGAAFAEGLGLRHYPAVIDAAGIRPGP